MNNIKRLSLAFILTLAVFIAEVIGGIVTGSLALLSDAAHMLTDLTALAISLAAIKIGQKPADNLRTFGYQRFEILAAALNTTLLFFVALYIFYEAYQRLLHPSPIHSLAMLFIALIGLISNVISMYLLSNNSISQKNLNVKSAYLEVWSDMVASIGVIIAAAIIFLTGLQWVDSLIAVLIGLWVLPRTWILLKESINILLEGVPKGIDLKKLLASCLKIKGITDIHELHVWGITSDKISLTAHVVIKPECDCESVINELRQFLLNEYGISHTTLQHEWKRCENAGDCAIRVDFL